MTVMRKFTFVLCWLSVFSLPWTYVDIGPRLFNVNRLCGMLVLVVGIGTVVLSGRIRRIHISQLAVAVFDIGSGST